MKGKGANSGTHQITNHTTHRGGRGYFGKEIYLLDIGELPLALERWAKDCEQHEQR